MIIYVTWVKIFGRNHPETGTLLKEVESFSRTPRNFIIHVVIKNNKGWLRPKICQ